MSKVEFVMADESAAARSGQFGQVERQLGTLELIWGIGAVRKTAIILALAVAWQLYATYLNNPLLFPTLTDTFEALYRRTMDGTLPNRMWTTLKILLTGYAIGTTLAAVLTVLAINTRIGTDFLETMTAMFNPLPAISLLPLALIWFGLGPASLVFVLIHSVLWAVALNTHTGFTSVSQTLRMVGANYELRGIPYVIKILIPAAFPSILTGLKIGWAFAWRTLIAAEMVFGVSSGSGGLGWFIFQSKNMLDIPSVFAGLLAVIVIGLIVEGVFFKILEDRTIRRWAMSS